MKIWLLNQYASSAINSRGGRHYDLARSLAEQGHDVTVVAARWTHLLRNGDEALSAPEVQYIDGFRFLVMDLPLYQHAHDRQRVINWFLFGWEVCRLDRKLPQRPNVILYSSPSLPGYLGAERLARRLGCKLIFEVRDIWPLTLTEVGGYSPRHPFIRFLQWVENRAYRRADAVFSNLPYAFEHMREHGLAAQKFHWVPNGIHVSSTQSRPLADSLRSCIPDAAFRVIYAGTLGVANALDDIIDAMDLLRTHADIQLVLVGGGKEESRLRARVAELGLANVIFLGSVAKQDVPALLALADVCYLGLKSSPLYRFGMALNKMFDYLAAGKPIIYAGDSGRYRPIETWQAGVQIAPENPEELAQAILQLQAMSVEEREFMGRNGRAAVMAEHDYPKIARRLSDLLEAIVGDGGAK